MSGGCDGAIRFWDIRRAGCFLVLDQLRSQQGRRPPFLDSAMEKVCLLVTDYFLSAFVGLIISSDCLLTGLKQNGLLFFCLQF
jgi:DNA excision repair protein ERCC-8